MKKFILYLVFFSLFIPLQLVHAQKEYVDVTEAEAVLDLMDGIATGQVQSREEIILHLQKIYQTKGYHILCTYQGMNPQKNSMMDRIYKVSWSIIHGQVDSLQGKDLIYYEIYRERDQYRQFLDQFQGWHPTQEMLNRAYAYFPEKKPFTGQVYFVVDEQSDGYTLVPNMVFSIYQIKKMLEEQRMDFNLELFPHEFHHILTKELLIGKYTNQLLDSSALSYFLGYIMLEGYAVHATAMPDTQANLYMMNQTPAEIFQLFEKIEKVIQLKGQHPDQHWRSIYREHFSSMIDIYTVGTTMVQAIEQRYGKMITVRVLENPPAFFKLYQVVAEQDDQLYQFDPVTLEYIIQAYQG